MRKSKKVITLAALVMSVALMGCSKDNKESDRETTRNVTTKETKTKTSKSEKEALAEDKKVIDNCATAIVMVLADPEAYEAIAVPKDGWETTVSGLTSNGGKMWKDEITVNLKDMIDYVFESEEAGKGDKLADCKVTLTEIGYVTVETPNGKIKVTK